MKGVDHTDQMMSYYRWAQITAMVHKTFCTCFANAYNEYTFANILYIRCTADCNIPLLAFREQIIEQLINSNKAPAIINPSPQPHRETEHLPSQLEETEDGRTGDKKRKRFRLYYLKG